MFRAIMNNSIAEFNESFFNNHMQYASMVLLVVNDRYLVSGELNRPA